MLDIKTVTIDTVPILQYQAALSDWPTIGGHAMVWIAKHQLFMLFYFYYIKKMTNMRFQSCTINTS